MTSLERGEAFANIDGGPEFAIDATDPGVEPPDLREQLTFEGNRLRPERIDPGHEPDIQAVDLLVQQTEVAANRAELRSDEVLKRFLDLIVDGHAGIESDPVRPVNVPVPMHSDPEAAQRS